MAYSNYGQVEPNHLSSQATKEIYAQLPCDFDVQNGMFLCYTAAEGKLSKPTAGGMEPMLVMSEVKVYEDRQGDGDFYIKADSNVYPRLFATKVGDKITTNVYTATDATGAFVIADRSELPEAKDVLTISGSGVLVPVADALAIYTDMEWTVVKSYTMPDGTPGIMVQRTK